MLLAVALFTACTKEIDFDFHEVDPIVVIEGRVTNEGSTVVVSRSRPLLAGSHRHHHGRGHHNTAAV